MSETELQSFNFLVAEQGYYRETWHSRRKAFYILLNFHKEIRLRETIKPLHEKGYFTKSEYLPTYPTGSKLYIF